MRARVSVLSELHGVRAVVLGERETGVQVLCEESSILFGFKILQDSTVDGLLHVLAVLGHFLFLSAN